MKNTRIRSFAAYAAMFVAVSFTTSASEQDCNDGWATCWRQYNECLASGTDPYECHQALDACLSGYGYPLP